MQALPSSNRRRSLPVTFFVAILSFVFAGQLLSPQPALSQQPALSYNRDVRPILSKHCFACHGPDDQTREAGARIDVADEIDLDEVLSRIEETDADLVMPPPEFNKPLNPKSIAVLKEWIAGGAKYQRHWSFVPPQKNKVTTTAHPVDFFIDQKLAAAQLAPTNKADAYTRIRRVHLDLIGLPPTVVAADKFARDPSQAAYEKIVDDLLASPRYGERWAQRWLDLARYADTNGYEKDRDRTMWPYRDWVIRAINQGKAFDQFTVEQLAGKPLPPSIIGDQRYAFIQPDAAVLEPQFEFDQYGDAGITLGSPLKQLGAVADDLCMVRAVTTDQFNHAPAQIFFNTGFSQPGRPCLGSWAMYGLGSETKDLPAFIVMSTGAGVSGGSSLWSSGFLPTTYTGVQFRNGREPILNVATPKNFSDEIQRDSIDLINRLNKNRFAEFEDPEIATRISSFEMAARLQTSAPELMDLKTETAETLQLYGCDPAKESFARSCLLARRMIQRGVRFINIYHSGWDAHSDVKGNTQNNCKATAQATAALITDLKRHGMLDETLVIWGGEFGRTPMVETNPTLGRKAGRDHHPQAFTMLMAGGGVKAGTTFGTTDDFGFNSIQNKVHVHDLQATILHLLGFDHKRLTFFHAGRDYRLTDVHGKVIREILA